VILVPAAVLGSHVYLGYGRQLPWLLDRPLRCLTLLRALESIGAGPPILDLGFYRVLV
jgi:hypothetical protein